MEYIYGEVRSDYEEDGIVYIDAWKTGNDNEQGVTVAKFYLETREIEWIREEAKKDIQVREEIENVFNDY